MKVTTLRSGYEFGRSLSASYAAIALLVTLLDLLPGNRMNSDKNYSTIYPEPIHSLSSAICQISIPPALISKDPELIQSELTGILSAARRLSSGLAARISSAGSSTQIFLTSISRNFIPPQQVRIPVPWTTSTRKRKKARRRSMPLYR